MKFSLKFTFICRFFIENSGNLYCELLADIDTDTLIVHGEKDVVVPDEHAHYLNKHIKNSR